MAQTIHRKVRNLYAGLTAEERVRLLARFTREQRDAETARLRDATPLEHGAAYNHAVRILRRLYLPFGPIATSALHAAERDVQGLRALFLTYHYQGRRLDDLAEVWGVIPYPVTTSEYAALHELERSEPVALDAFATYMVEREADDLEALGANAAYRAVWAAQTEDTPYEAAQAECRALLDQAIRRGELPRPKRTKQGPLLPRGVLQDWLHGRDTSQAPILDLSELVPAVKLLRGYRATWEMHADRDADAVRARRERLLRTLAHQAGLDPAQCPSMHPPRTRAEQEAMRRAAQAVSPQAEPPHLREAVEALGRRHAESRALVRALRDVADRAQHEACGGEDPLTPETRAVLEQAEAQLQEFAEDWQRWAPLLVVEDWVPLGDWPAGERLPPAWPEVPLPDAPPELYPRLYERLWAMMTTEAL